MVSHDGVLTFNEIEETVNTRWASHNPINDAVISEFLGPGQEEKTFKMFFSAALGVDPAESLESLRKSARAGEHFPIVLGGVPLGEYDWYIDNVGSVSTSFRPLDGKAQWSEVTVTVKEYY
jgi:phage protein U